jgi:hypothetical protein
MTHAIDDNEPELLTGAEQIAAFFGWPARRVHYMRATGRMPCIFRVGGLLCMRPATGRAWLRAMERRAGEPGDAA